MGQYWLFEGSKPSTPLGVYFVTDSQSTCAPSGIIGIDDYAKWSTWFGNTKKAIMARDHLEVDKPLTLKPSRYYLFDQALGPNSSSSQHLYVHVADSMVRSLSVDSPRSILLSALCEF